MRARGLSPLGLAVHPREGLRGVGRPGVEERILEALGRDGELGLGELYPALHCNVAQARLHAAIAALEAAGVVEVRRERRGGRTRTVVGLKEGC